ncbi:hypothetical protein C1645_735632 [Glomus cerebriforme]|uniref:Uncharacterized protein n=1 Tax=Glomus cerebriforme TaxID=658196 RepID=A0A397T4Z2_9GLOM|nr:hypothetical protein C1645_735632 [Glomus cerebriforme]
MGKITTTEFESYGQKFFPLFVRLLERPDFKALDETERKQIESLLGFILSQIKLENVWMLFAASELVEKGLKEDLSAIKKRVKEHIVARGNYNPASPLSLAEFREIKKQRVNYQSIIDQLTTEKSSLEAQKNQLEKKVATSDQEKALQAQTITQINEQLRQKEQEIKNLKEKPKPKDKDKKNNPSTSEKNNSTLIK